MLKTFGLVSFRRGSFFLLFLSITASLSMLYREYQVMFNFSSQQNETMGSNAGSKLENQSLHQIVLYTS